MITLLLVLSLSWYTHGYIQDLYVAQGKGKDCSWGMNRVQVVGKANGDLNQGAGGKYLYLCVRETSDIKSSIITGLIIEGNSLSSSQSYPVCASSAPGASIVDYGDGANGDLNQGVGGWYLYLCATKNRNSIGRHMTRGALSALYLIEGDESTCPTDANKIDVYNPVAGTSAPPTGNLNQGSFWGRDLFLCAHFDPIPDDLPEWERSVGRWDMVADAYNGAIGHSISEGSTTTYTEGITEQWSNSFRTGVEGGVDFLGKATVSMSADFAKSTSESISKAVTTTQTNTCQVTCEREAGKHVWVYQWMVDGFFGKDTSTPDGSVRTCSYRCHYTDGSQVPPQCPLQACRDEYCTDTRCLPWADPH